MKNPRQDWRGFQIFLHILIGIEVSHVGDEVFLNTMLTISTTDTYEDM